MFPSHFFHIGFNSVSVISPKLNFTRNGHQKTGPKSNNLLRCFKTTFSSFIFYYRQHLQPFFFFSLCNFYSPLSPHQLPLPTAEISLSERRWRAEVVGGPASETRTASLGGRARRPQPRPGEAAFSSSRHSGREMREDRQEQRQPSSRTTKARRAPSQSAACDVMADVTSH